MTLTVQNPGGTLNLVVNYTLISERPIEPQDVVTEDANYQVAQVGFFVMPYLQICRIFGIRGRIRGFDEFLGFP